MLNMFDRSRDGLSRTSDGAWLMRHNEKHAAMPDGTKRHPLVCEMEDNGARRLRYRLAEGRKMSTAPQIAFDKNDPFLSSGVPPNYFQLFATLTSQATSSEVEFRTLIEGFVDSIARARQCDCAYIALLDPEDSQTF